MDKETFGRFIADTRRNAGISQQQLAERLHVTNTAVSKWERGLCYPDITLLEKLAFSLNLSLGELMACEKTSHVNSQSPCSEVNFVSLLDIAKDSKRKQRNRILRNTLCIALTILLLLVVVFFGITLFKTHSACAVYIGSHTNNSQNYVYMDIQGKLYPFICEDSQMLQAIKTGHNNQRYIIAYSWNIFSKKGVLKSYHADDAVVGTPIDINGSTIEIGNLLGFYGVTQEIANVSPDPNQPYYHLYTLKYYCYYKGNRYNFLTVNNCRNFAFYDYDCDGVVELFIDTKYDNAPFLLYDTIAGVITSHFVDEVPQEVSNLFQSFSLDGNG